MNIESQLHPKPRTEDLEQIIQTKSENSVVEPLYNTTNNNNNQKINDYIDLISNFFNDLFYIKKSLGKDGNLINVYKLRTMKKNSDHLFSQLAQKGLDETGNIKNDPRVTPRGEVLRKFWIDEIPQLYNFLKGEMKVVGIRPMSEDHWKNYPEDIKKEALKYKPGLLGVNYALRKKDGSEDGIIVMRKYLEEYGQANKLMTDIKYFGIITHNILFNGVRSS